MRMCVLVAVFFVIANKEMITEKRQKLQIGLSEVYLVCTAQHRSFLLL
jgi:hypothetical protein